MIPRHNPATVALLLLCAAVLVAADYTIYHNDSRVVYTDKSDTWTTYLGTACPSVLFLDVKETTDPRSGGQKIRIPFKGSRISLYGVINGEDPDCNFQVSVDGSPAIRQTVNLKVAPGATACNVQYFQSQLLTYEEHTLEITVGDLSGGSFNFHRAEVEEDMTMTPPVTSSSNPEPSGSSGMSGIVSPENDQGLSMAALGAIIGASVLVLGLIVMFLVFCCRRRKPAKKRYQGSLDLATVADRQSQGRASPRDRSMEYSPHMPLISARTSTTQTHIEGYGPYDPSKLEKQEKFHYPSPYPGLSNTKRPWRHRLVAANPDDSRSSSSGATTPARSERHALSTSQIVGLMERLAAMKVPTPAILKIVDGVTDNTCGAGGAPPSRDTKQLKSPGDIPRIPTPPPTYYQSKP